jgi:protocatechuate 3,4-dioxygenase beta subunit
MPNPDPISNSKAAPNGRVLDPAGAPVAEAVVLLYHRVSHWGLGNSIVEKVVTDAGGRFAFTTPLTFKTPSGTDRHDHYILIATRDGFAPAWTLIVGGTPERNEITLQLTAPVSETFEVVDMDKNPVEGATVWLSYASAQGDKAPLFPEAMTLPEDLGVWRATTDASGRVTLTNLPDTTYGIVATQLGCEVQHRAETLPDGVARFLLRFEGTLEGRVLDPAGAPVEDATVWVYPKWRFHVYFMAKTNADGRYRIEKIYGKGQTDGSGEYQAGIRDPRFTAVTRDVSFTPGQTVTGFDFAAIAGTEIVGRLLDPTTEQPVAGAEVYIDSPVGRQTRLTDLGGGFRCRVTEGTVRIFFGLPPGGTFSIENRRDLGSSLQISAFGAELPVTLYAPGIMGKLGTVHGRVVDANGQPVARCAVSAAMTDKPAARIHALGWVGNIFRGVHTDADGRFTYTLPVGMAFTLTVENPATAESGMLSGRLASDSMEMPEPIVLHATSGAELILTDLSGAPRPNFAVEVTPQAKGVDLWLNKKEVTTDAQGRLHLDHIAPGLTYRMAQKDSHHTSSTFDPANLAAANATRLLITDHYILRVLDEHGQTIPVVSLKEFFVWIQHDGKPVRWTNQLPDSLERFGAELTLPRKTIAVGRPGNKIDLLLESATGDLVRATGTIPDGSVGIILANVTGMAAADFTLDPSLGPVGAHEVVGRVVDPEGRPIAGATITFNNVHFFGAPNAAGEPTSARHQPSFATDADGIFRVSANKDQWFYYETVFKEGFAPVFLTDIPRGKGFVVKLQKTARFAGSIAGANPGRVSLLLETDKDSSRKEIGNKVRGIQYRTETNAEGAYDFPMEPGRYRFKAISADGRFAAGEVTLNANQIVALPAILQPGIPVTFRLADCQTGHPVPGIEIGIMEQLANGGYTTREENNRTSDESGTVRWDNLMPGKTQFSSRRMTHSFPGHELLPYSRWWWPSAPEDHRRIDYAKQPPTRGTGVHDISIDVRNNMEPVSILLEKGVKISGTVVGPDDVPQKGALIGVVPNDGVSETLTGDSRFSLLTDREGKFSGYIPAGNGVVYNLCAYYRPETRSSFANAVSEPFRSKPGDELTFPLKMSKGGWITGKLLDPEGKPTEGPQVTATNADRMDLAYAKRIATPDKDGNFQLGPLRSGHYTVQSGKGPGVPLRVDQATPANSKGIDVSDDQKSDIGTLIVPL